MNIRPAIEEDLPLVLELYAQPEIDQGESLSVEEAAMIFQRFTQYPNYRLFVAVADSVVVGTFALLIMDNLGHLGKPSAVVEDVAVRPDRQGQGIGKRMIEYAMDESRKAACYKLTLSADLRRTAAHAFYESLGFQRHGYSYKIDFDA